MEHFPKPAHKRFVSVGDNIQRQAILAVLVLEEEASKALGHYIRTAWDKTEFRAQMVCYNRNVIETTVF